jgi:RIO kinase 1
MSSDFVLKPDFALDWQTTDDLLDGQRQSTYPDAEKLCKGPDPVPDWVVTERAAVDTYLGILKTGKEADCFLMERSVPGGRSSILASKQYRGEEHRLFHRDADYTDGRRTKRSRDARALEKKTAWGRSVAAGQWAWAEWEALRRFWSAGVPVPYPVQLQGTELLMELIEYDGEAAPRLAQARPTPALLASYFDQLRNAMMTLARNGVAHGDLSPYNVLAAGERLVIIDLPQVVDLVANPAGLDFLMRDCHNVSTWFVRRGLDVDEDALFADVLTQVY